MKTTIILTLVVIAVAAEGLLLANTVTVSNTLNANINAVGDITSVVPSTVSLTKSGTTFDAFAGSVTVNYNARTSSAGGGTITLKATSDFLPSGGPSVSRGDLSYTCSGSSLLATPCSSSVTVSSSATTVITLSPSGCSGGGAPCSPSSPNSAVVSFTLIDDASDQTGSFLLNNIQFTVSAT